MAPPSLILMMMSDSVKVWRQYLYMVPGGDITEEIAQMDCVIFLRTQEAGIAEPRDTKDPLAINRIMARHFDTVTLQSDRLDNALVLLEDVLVEVYMPLLAYFEHRMSYVPSTETVQQPVSAKGSVDRVSTKSSEGKASVSTGLAFTMLRDEFVHQVPVFLSWS